MTIAQISNGELGLNVRTKLNSVIDLTGTSHPYTSSSVVFVDGSGNFAQDNTDFKWDSTNNALTVGAGKLSMALVSGYANVFLGNTVGNFTATGNGNTAIGDNTMPAVTSGSANVGIGVLALNHLTTGANNFGLGSQALAQLTTADGNVAVGATAMGSMITGSTNVAIGLGALYAAQVGSRNICIGDGSAANLNNTNGSYNTVIGARSGLSLTSGYGNTIIGGNDSGSTGPTSGDCNVVVGLRGGGNIGNGSNNTLLGAWSPGSAISSVIGLSDGAGNLRLDYGYTASSTWTLAGGVLNFSGTTASIKVNGTERANFNISNSGWLFNPSVSVDSGTITANAPAFNFAQTWNNAAVNFTASAITVTSTAAGANSYVQWMTLNSAAVFSVRADSYTQSIAFADQNEIVALGNGFSGSVNGVSLGSAAVVKFNSGTQWFTGADTGLARNAAGVLEINSGTSGTFRDLKLRSSLYAGSTSGTISIVPQAAAGTYNFNLPTTAGTAGQVLTSQGGGSTAMTWASAGAASMAIGSAVTGATAGSVLFAGAGPVLAQDNTNLFWDDSNDILKAGVALQQRVNSVYVNALFPVYHASGNNWFVGQAGNTSVSGAGNTGIGAGALGAVTSGGLNTAIGLNALNALVGGSGNTVIGYAAGTSITSGSNNTLVGNWPGVAALSNVIGLSDSSGNLRLDYNYIAVDAWTATNTATSAMSLNLNNTSSGGRGYFLSSTGSGSGYGAGNFALWDAATFAVFSYKRSINTLALNDTEVFGWGTDAYANAAVDIGLARNAAGVLEINNGTAGTLRGLKADNAVITSTTTTIPLQVITASVDSTNILLSNTSTGGHPFFFFSTGQLNNPGNFGIYDGATGYAVLALDGVGNFRVNGSGSFAWSSNASNAAIAWDTALSRNAAGVVEVNNGTAGTFRDLKLRSLLYGGTTSGVITMQTQAAAGTYNWNWPITAGSAGQVLTSQAGGSTAMTWTTPVPAASPTFTGTITAATANFSGPVAVTDTTAASSNTTGALKVTGGAGIAKDLYLATGTTAIAPMTFTSGINLTTARAGALEYDGTVFYASPQASSRGVNISKYMIRQDATYTLTSNTSVQKLFSTTNGAITLTTGTYYFECLVYLTTMNATSGNAAFSLAGSSTRGSYLWYWTAFDGAADATSAFQSGVSTGAATPAAMATAAVSTTMPFFAKGTFEVTAQGTVIPSIQLLTANAAVVAIGSYFMCYPMGTVTLASVGNWS